MGLLKKVGAGKPHISWVEDFDKKVELNVIFRMSKDMSERFLTDAIKKQMAKSYGADELEDLSDEIKATAKKMQDKLEAYNGSVCNLKMAKQKPNGEIQETPVSYWGFEIKGMAVLEKVGEYGNATLIFPYQENVVLDANLSVLQNLDSNAQPYLRMIHTNSNGKYDFTQILKVMDVLNAYGAELMDMGNHKGLADLDTLHAKIPQAQEVMLPAIDDAPVAPAQTSVKAIVDALKNGDKSPATQIKPTL
ncbi:MAG: hypothetical protein LBM38_03600 [Clostridiales bacterium]|jgi:hypothetical protein|nr:hypothetical protein [Clostridiales bacterium]